MTCTGVFRLYFNKRSAAPLVWCVGDDGEHWELAVEGIDCQVPTKTIYRPKTTPDDKDNKPSAWLAARGVLRVTNGIASIKAD